MNILSSPSNPTAIKDFLKEELIHEGRRITLVKKTFLLESGNIVERESVKHPGAVVIIPVLENGDLLLLDQYRFSIERRILEFPAGTKELPETSIETAARELIEETKYQASSLKSLGTIVPTPGFCNEVQEIFVATGLIPTTSEYDEGEDIICKSFAPSQVKDMIASGEIEDAKTIASFFKALLSNDIKLDKKNNV